MRIGANARHQPMQLSGAAVIDLAVVLAALRAYRDRCKGQPLKVAAVNRCISIVRRLGK